MFWFQAAADGVVPPLVPSPLKAVAWKMLLGFAALELALMKWMPGAEFKAMPTPTGHVPTYTVRAARRRRCGAPVDSSCAARSCEE